MRLTITALVVLATSCACQPSQNGAHGEVKGEEVIGGLVLVDPSSPQVPSHPLICARDGDYPHGTELVFRGKDDPGKWVHAVFPQGVKVPRKPGGAVVLRGRFQKIRNRERFVYKKPPNDYRYFVVTSWTDEK